MEKMIHIFIADNRNYAYPLNPSVDYIPRLVSLSLGAKVKFGLPTLHTEWQCKDSTMIIPEPFY